MSAKVEAPTTSRSFMLEILDQKAAEGPKGLQKMAQYARVYISDVTLFNGTGVAQDSHMDVVIRRILFHLESAPECRSEYEQLCGLHASAREQYEARRSAMVEDLTTCPKTEA